MMGLAHCFSFADDKGNPCSSQLPRTFLLMHRWYLPSTELAGKLLSTYPFTKCCKLALQCQEQIGFLTACKNVPID